MRLPSFPFAFPLLLVACGASPTGGDAGAGAPTDGGGDAGAADARAGDGAGPDASPDDAGGADAGPADAGEGDAIPGDADLLPDSATDAGVTILVGADAGMLTDASLACTATPGPHPAWHTSLPGVSISADGKRTLTVPDGFQVTANVRLAAPLPGATSAFANISSDDYPSRQRFDMGGTDSVPLVLPAGAFPLTYTVQATLSSATTVMRRGFQILDVCGDATLDVVLPAFPPLSPVTLTLDHLDLLGLPAGVSGFDFTLTTPDQTLTVSTNVTVATGATSAAATLMVPLGVSLIPQFGLGSGPLGPPVTIAGDSTIPAPPQITLSGTVTDSDAIDLTQSEVECYEGQLPSFTTPFPPSGQESSGLLTGTPSPYSYSFGIGQGATCTLVSTLHFSAPPMDGGAPLIQGYLESPLTAQSTAASARHDFAFPPVGAPVTLATSVVDARGAPLSGTVYAYSTELAGGAFAGYGFVSLTPSGGSLLLLPGTYELIAGP